MTTSPQFQITLFGAFNTRFLFGYENKPLLERKTSFLKDKSLYWFFQYSTQPLNIQTVERDPQTKSALLPGWQYLWRSRQRDADSSGGLGTRRLPSRHHLLITPFRQGLLHAWWLQRAKHAFPLFIDIWVLFNMFSSYEKDQNNLKEASMTNPCFYYSACVGWRKGDNMDFMRADLFIFTHKHVSSHFISRTDGQMHFQ